MNTINAILLAVSIIANVTEMSFNNLFGKKFIKTRTDITRLMVCSSIFSIITFAIIALFTGGLRVPSFYTVYMGILFGIILLCYYLFSYRALEIGPFAYTSLFSSCGMVLSVAFGIAWFHESADVFQIIGVILILIMFYFNANPKKNENISLKWFILAIAVFFMTGGFGIMQKLFQRYTPDAEPQMTEFLMIAFFFSTVCSSGIVLKNEKSLKKALDFDKRIIAVSAVTGVCIAINHYLCLYLAGVMPSIIVFPVHDGAAVVLCTIVSATVFREKYNLKQYVGLGLGIAAILLLSGIMNNFIKA